MEQKKTLNNLGGFRAIASWMVCMYHASFIISGHYPGIGAVLDWGQEGVYVFFVISGLVLPWSMVHGNYKWEFAGKFMLKRFIRLYPPLLLSIVAWLLYFRMGSGSLDSKVLNIALDTALLIVPFKGSLWINNLYWTLFVLFQFYLFQAITFPFLANKNTWIRRIAFLATLAFSFFALLFPLQDFKIVVTFHLPVFTMGLLLCLYLNKIMGVAEFIISFIITAATCAYLTGHVYGCGYHITIVAVLTFLGILVVKRTPRWLDFIGNISYSFYLIHGVIIYTVLYYLPNFKTTENGSMITFLLIQVLAILAAWIFYYIIEKPAEGWTKLIKYKSKEEVKS